MRWFCAALLIASLGASASAAPRILAGRVLNSEGEPVAGTEVTAYFAFPGPAPYKARREQAERTVVGADGRFAFKLTFPTNCDWAVVLARHAGLAPSWADFECRESGTYVSYTYEYKDIVLEPTASISGTVRDVAGNPVVGANVTADLYLPRLENGEERLIVGGPPLDWLRTKTDAQGNFTVRELPNSSFVALHVTAAGKGGLFLQRLFESVGAFEAGSADIRVTLQPEARILGTVVDEESRKPLAGVPVLVAPEYHAPVTDGQVCVTGPDGVFEASGLPPADYTISLARLLGDSPAMVAKPLAVKDVRAGETRKDVLLATSRGSLLEILVQNEKKAPISGARVWLQTFGDAFGIFTAFSGKDGIAVFRLVPGECRVFEVDHDLYLRPSPESLDVLTVQKGKTTRAELTLSARPRASGIVFDPQGKPVAGATISVLPSSGKERDMTDEEGKFVVAWQPWDTVGAGLFVRKPETDLAAVFSMEDRQQTDNLKITLAPAVKVAGRVTDPDGKPIPLADVQAIIDQHRFASHLIERIKTDSDGKYVIHSLPLGQDYCLEVQANGFGRAMTSVDPAAAEDRSIEMAPIILKRGNLTITGIVVDEDDKPVSGAEVFAFGAEQNIRPVQSDKDGKFTLKNICDADATIQALKQQGRQGPLVGTVHFSHFLRDMEQIKIVLGQK